MSQHIIVTDYNPLWKEKYEEEALLIRKILADNCITIYHIGSTSVKGLAAKPVIDIMVVVKSLKKVDDVAKDFSKAGYEYLGEFGIEGRRYLRKGGDERTHQIHIFQAEDWYNIGRHLAFRDYMRTHEKERNEYAKIKAELARRFPYDIDGYCNGKKILCVKSKNLLFLSLMEHGIRCILLHGMFNAKGKFPRSLKREVFLRQFLRQKGRSMSVSALIRPVLWECAQKEMPLRT